MKKNTVILSHLLKFYPVPFSQLFSYSMTDFFCKFFYFHIFPLSALSMIFYHDFESRPAISPHATAPAHNLVYCPALCTKGNIPFLSWENNRLTNYRLCIEENKMQSGKREYLQPCGAGLKTAKDISCRIRKKDTKHGINIHRFWYQF